MPSLRKHVTFAAIAATLIASAVLVSVAAAGGGGVGTGGGGTGGGGGHDYVFPIPSSHSYGDGFGAGRNHQGQDVFAPCGNKLIAIHSGKVQLVARHSAAGNYIVLDVDGSGIDYAYMHLRKTAIPRQGANVRKGEKIGEVGETGNASGCHLHFEKWSAPGYYEGGQASKSVTKTLKKWDSWS